MGKPEGKRPLTRPIHKGVNNIKMDFMRAKMEWYGLY
jgi:hypothetical protein